MLDRDGFVISLRNTAKSCSDVLSNLLCYFHGANHIQILYTLLDLLFSFLNKADHLFNPVVIGMIGKQLNVIITGTANPRGLDAFTAYRRAA